MFDDKKMILSESDWPGDTLCLKKRPKPGEATKGVMGYSAFGILTNSRAPFIVLLRPDFEKTMNYDSVDELLADGWIVD
jgi:hypothetical protein